MAVSKRLRFEILKRDNHTCRYCGATAPDVTLTVDHVTPVALGGTDEPTNLVTACRDCNAGKSSTKPDAQTVEQVDEDAIRWAEAVKRAASLAEQCMEDDRYRHEWFVDSWSKWDPSLSSLPNGWEKSLDCWLTAGMTQPLMLDALDIALGNRAVTHRDVFAYMGGIARKRIEQIHADAKAFIASEKSN